MALPRYFVLLAALLGALSFLTVTSVSFAEAPDSAQFAPGEEPDEVSAIDDPCGVDDSNEPPDDGDDVIGAGPPEDSGERAVLRGTDPDDCFDIGEDDGATNNINDVAFDPLSRSDLKKLSSNGSVDQEFSMPGAGTIDQSLTTGASSRAATAAGTAKGNVLGSAHQTVSKYGVATVTLKLNSKGRRMLRKANRALRLTLTTTVRLASGQSSVDTAKVTVKPRKKPKTH